MNIFMQGRSLKPQALTEHNQTNENIVGKKMKILLTEMKKNDNIYWNDKYTQSSGCKDFFMTWLD